MVQKQTGELNELQKEKGGRERGVGEEGEGEWERKGGPMRIEGGRTRRKGEEG